MPGSWAGVGEPDHRGVSPAGDCALSRMWSGVHFRAACIQGAALGEQIGDSVYVFVDQYIRGAVGALR